MLMRNKKFRSAVVRIGLVFYRKHLKRTKFGRWLGAQVLRYGLIGPLEIQLSGLAVSRPFAENPNSEVGSQINQKENKEYIVEVDQLEAEHPVPGFHLSPPLNLVISANLSRQPYINVLLPSLRTQHMSGGPNTALLFAAMLAEQGERVRLIACDAPTDGKAEELFPHMDSLLQRPIKRENIEFMDAFDRASAKLIGANDIFFATAWWTAQIAREAAKKTKFKKIIYLIQDFEPILHAGSTFYARALETYGFDHIPLINTKFLHDHLVKEKSGRFADPQFSQKSIVFEPALDKDHFFPVERHGSKKQKKVILFYARPTVAQRNLFEIGLVALRDVVASGAICQETWEVWAMGEDIPSISLGKGMYLNPLPWMSYEDYTKRVRTADLMLSLMLSPHPSYPPIEMAACGNLVVTNSFSVKTEQRLQELSPNIIVADPNVESISHAIQRAVGRLNMGMGPYDSSGEINLPASWNESLRDAVDQLCLQIQALRRVPQNLDNISLNGLPVAPTTSYESYRLSRLARRRQTRTCRKGSELFSFVTSAFDTDPVFLEELGQSVFAQDGGTEFEWFILDNGSTRKDTRDALKRLALHPCVQLVRVEDNLGIIGGMRYCLERAKGRYILPLDSDDLIEPDCVNTLTSYIIRNNFPPLVYTDEDKVNGELFGSPYFKPDWDPVLFIHSCYIAHLCAIDRKLAIQLDLYSDSGSEGCHDWDTFFRFMMAGHLPCHVPEVLYSWRVHNNSTSGNIHSKNYISESHKYTLQKYITNAGVSNIELVSSPFFSQNVDWWFRRRRDDQRPFQSFLCRKERVEKVPGRKANTFDDIVDGRTVDLATYLERFDGEFIHLGFHGFSPDSDEWEWDALGLFELFPDAVVIGGLIHDGEKIIDGPSVFGFGDGCGCPDVGRELSDPGYFAKLFKAHTASAVPVGHCVVRTHFLKNCMPELLRENVPFDMIGLWLGALALECDARVIFSPFMRARGLVGRLGDALLSDKAHFLSRFWPQIPDNRSYSPRLGLMEGKAYVEVESEANRQHLLHMQSKLLEYPMWLDMQMRRRRALYPVPEHVASITIITTIYEKTDISLLAELAQSIAAQTVKAAQWIIVAHGSIPDAIVKEVLSLSTSSWNAEVIIDPEPLGIMRAMHRGLEHAVGSYIVPVDADDVLTQDAIQIFCSAIQSREYPDLIFSDEDLLVDGRPVAPFLRGSFDPVMNLDSSYVWHMVAIKRETAIARSIYSDQGAEWCHDWNSITLIANAGGRVEHVPEVLYHWRQHAGSTTNNETGDPRSLDSVRHVLNRHIASMRDPKLFHVADWPMRRGAPELYIARSSENLPQFLWFGDIASEIGNQVNDDAIVVLAANGLRVQSEEVLVEVVRLMDLHPKIGAVGGLVEGKDGVIMDGCYLMDPQGFLVSPWLGHDISWSGPFALAQKTQSVAATGGSLAFFRVSALKEIGSWPVFADVDPSELAIHLSSRLTRFGWVVAFSPLIRAQSFKAVVSRRKLSATSSVCAPGNGSLLRYGDVCEFQIERKF